MPFNYDIGDVFSFICLCFSMCNFFFLLHLANRIGDIKYSLGLLHKKIKKNNKNNKE